MTPSFIPPSLLPAQPKFASRTIADGSLIIQDILGVGAYGSVHRAIDMSSSHIRAVKCLNHAGLNSRQHAFQIQEAEMHARVTGHPNIATLHSVTEEGDNLFMVLDYGADGDLFYNITERGGIVGNETRIKSIFDQIASAVMHCHSRGVYHRDLKPENIIISNGSVKLVDFGLATTEAISSDFGCGSAYYLSPECQGGYIEMVKSYDSAANDVWSLGVILINLVFGRNPWKQSCAKDETFSAYANNRDFLQTILPMSSELNEIIKAVFCINPQHRIKLPELARRVQACKGFVKNVNKVTSGCSAFTIAVASTQAGPVQPQQ
ncbi:hypothetical protein EDD11_010548 [Mortierella claussenii]|nr:hypothetical protein EDD11_010548 [Mortierella claussenii]